MILQGSQRGGTKDLALHLLKSENEHVTVHELRGFVSDDLVGAFAEINAVSKGTRAKQPMFSLSLNPPPNEDVSTEDFISAIARVEKELGLDNQPRAIVFHEKEGRRHAHAVWSRIDTSEMKAIPLPYTKYKLRDLSRELYIEHDWTMPRGFVNSEERDPKNFTLAQWQQAKRAGKDPRGVMDALRDSWAISDSQAAFKQALKERGYILARGDRRGFVAIDHNCEIYAINKKWVGLVAKDVRAKLTDNQNLPSVDDAKAQIAHDMAGRMGQLQRQQQAAIQNRLSQVANKYRQLANDHKREREALKQLQQKRWFEEVRQRQERYNTGLKALLDRVTGRHSQIKKQNEIETLQASRRDQQERDAMIFRQMEQRQALKLRLERLFDYKEQQKQELTRDKAEYKAVQAKKQDKPQLSAKTDALRQKRKSSLESFRQAAKDHNQPSDFKQRMKNRTRGLDRER